MLGKKIISLCVDKLQSLVDLAGKTLDVLRLLPRVGLSGERVVELDLGKFLLERVGVIV